MGIYRIYGGRILSAFHISCTWCFLRGTSYVGVVSLYSGQLTTLLPAWIFFSPKASRCLDSLSEGLPVKSFEWALDFNLYHYGSIGFKLLYCRAASQTLAPRLTVQWYDAQLPGSCLSLVACPIKDKYYKKLKVPAAKFRSPYWFFW
jgi:hypothetical protein